jgi:hypothetical protein
MVMVIKMNIPKWSCDPSQDKTFAPGMANDYF